MSTVRGDSKPPTRRVRRVSRVVRDIDVWSVLRIAAVFHAVMYAMILVAGLLVWNVGSATGTIDNIEQFMESFGWDSFTFDGGRVFGSFAVLGLFGVVAGTVLWVLGALVFNLISELVGGVKVTVLEEEVVPRPVERDRNRG